MDGKNPRRGGSPTLTGGDFGSKWVSGTGIPELEKSPTGMGRGWAGMEDNPLMGTGTGIPRNLINGDEFGDGGGDGEREWGWYCHTRPLPDPLSSLISTKPCVYVFY
ncbi:Hypothetical predicted protein [Prunus dulcis]|uniref:Uncharacterized protein n=1 Tax=Prunus dulcis TaxID=3755 RepID=A0A5E4GB52_PRUDU|nr:hypothetical protein L3X38_004109 [Prunus dulcis]VVA36926.1 Hypothetical predicted protein [Prunus dulcis]